MELSNTKKFLSKSYKTAKTAVAWIWAHPIVPVSALLVIIVLTCAGNSKARKNYKTEIKRLNDSISSISSERDSLECLYRVENLVTMKAGEFAIRPHSEETEITEEAVAELLTELEAWFPDIKMAQYQIESGFGSSKMAKSANNISGMRKTNKRQTTQIKHEEYCGYGKYNNWESFIIDHVLWDYSVFGCRKPTRKEYIEKLNKIYSAHDDYGYVMDKTSRQYRKYFKNTDR